MTKFVKDKFCKQCGDKFKPLNSLQQVCSPKCAILYNSKKEIEKRVKVMRKESRSISELKNIARQVFQQWIRLRDSKEGCISCPRTEAKWDGGHMFKAEVYTGLIFEPMNCNKQCSYCNQYLSGNLIDYRKGLIKKYGEAAVEALEARADSSRVYKFTQQELIDITNEYKQKIKEFKNPVKLSA
jgi:hypothetical protein